MCKTERILPNRALPFVDGVLLWAMRAWVLGLSEKIPVEEQIQDALVKIGAPDATAHLFGLMWCLGHGGCRTIDVRCVCVQGVSEDERCLLDVVALSQRARRFEALLVLRSLVRPAAAIAAQDAAAGIAASLAAAGRIVTLNQMDTTRYVLAADGWPSESRAARATLH